MIIQIIGLPGAGKTALAKSIKEHIEAIHLNADEVRSTINSDLGFSIKDRIEQSRRMGEMARLLSNQNYNVIVDFVCPTNDTRKAFGKPDVLIWVDRITLSRYKDTNILWESPQNFDILVSSGMTIEEEVQLVLRSINV